MYKDIYENIIHGWKNKMKQHEIGNKENTPQSDNKWINFDTSSLLNTTLFKNCYIENIMKKLVCEFYYLPLTQTLKRLAKCTMPLYIDFCIWKYKPLSLNILIVLAFMGLLLLF